MRSWGIVITSAYALILVGLLLPGVYLIAGNPVAGILEFYREWFVWFSLGLLIAGQALLLFLSVDSSHKRLRPRQHLLASLATVALMCALLSFAAIWSLLSGLFGDSIFADPFKMFIDGRSKILAWWAVLWGAWYIIFYTYFQDNFTRLTRVMNWLLRGSILELLVAIPAHVWVRHKQECSAPMATGLGVATGIAIMLLSFGPGVLFLYKKRLARYQRTASGDQA
jgi:hypothetical protein